MSGLPNTVQWLLMDMPSNRSPMMMMIIIIIIINKEYACQ